MLPNSTESSSELIDALVVQAITDAVDGIGEGETSAEEVDARANQRYRQLTTPSGGDFDDHVADIVQTSLTEIAHRHVVTGGEDPFSVEKVVDASMARLERLFGAPKDRRRARRSIREYIDEAHGLESDLSAV